jgi:hypothetical protein
MNFSKPEIKSALTSTSLRFYQIQTAISSLHHSNTSYRISTVIWIESPQIASQTPVSGTYPKLISGYFLGARCVCIRTYTFQKHNFVPIFYFSQTWNGTIMHVGGLVEWNLGILYIYIYIYIYIYTHTHTHTRRVYIC